MKKCRLECVNKKVSTDGPTDGRTDQKTIVPPKPHHAAAKKRINMGRWVGSIKVQQIEAQ